MDNKDLNQTPEDIAETQAGGESAKKKNKKVRTFQEKMLFAIVIELAVIALVMCISLIYTIISDNGGYDGDEAGVMYGQQDMYMVNPETQQAYGFSFSTMEEMTDDDCDDDDIDIDDCDDDDDDDEDIDIDDCDDDEDDDADMDIGESVYDNTGDSWNKNNCNPYVESKGDFPCPKLDDGADVGFGPMGYNPGRSGECYNEEIMEPESACYDDEKSTCVSPKENESTCVSPKETKSGCGCR